MRHAIHPFVFAAVLSAAVPVRAQPADATALSGRWSGTYVCSQGETALELTLRGNAHGIVRGTFAFSPTPQNPEVLTGSYPVLGRLTGTSLVLRPVDVRQMPGAYVPVGIQATVERGGARIAGWIEGPICGIVTLQRTAASSPADPLVGGYGEQQWTPVAESAAGTLYVDGRDPPDTGASTTRTWMRWHSTTQTPWLGLLAGQAAEWEMEFDCEARLVRVWHTLIYAADGQMQDVDASAPYAWAPVGQGSLDEHAWSHACSGEPPSTR